MPILTAWDPGEDRPGLEVNRRLGAELEAALRPRARRLLEAVGVDPDSEHREEGVAALGLSVDEAVALGRALPAGGHFRVDPGRLVDRLVPGRAPGRLRLVDCAAASDVRRAAIVGQRSTAPVSLYARAHPPFRASRTVHLPEHRQKYASARS